MAIQPPPQGLTFALLRALPVSLLGLVVDGPGLAPQHVSAARGSGGGLGTESLETAHCISLNMKGPLRSPEIVAAVYLTLAPESQGCYKQLEVAGGQGPDLTARRDMLMLNWICWPEPGRFGGCWTLNLPKMSAMTTLPASASDTILRRKPVRWLHQGWVSRARCDKRGRRRQEEWGWNRFKVGTGVNVRRLVLALAVGSDEMRAARRKQLAQGVLVLFSDERRPGAA